MFEPVPRPSASLWRVRNGSFRLKSEFDPSSADLEDEFSKCLADDWQPSYDNEIDEESPDIDEKVTEEDGDAMELERQLSFESPAKSTPLSPDFLDSSVSLCVSSPTTDLAMRRRAEAAEEAVEELRSELASLKAEREKERGEHAKEVKAMEEAFEALKLRYDQVKAQLAQTAQNDTTLRTALEKSTEQYGRLKAHAQDKLRRANSEIVRLRMVNECQHAALYAKALQSGFRTRTAQAEASAAKAEAQSLRDALLLTKSH